MTLTVRKLVNQAHFDSLDRLTLHPDPESRGGQHLLRRTEFHGQTEYRTSALIARGRTKDTGIPQAKLICGASRPPCHTNLYKRSDRINRWFSVVFHICRRKRFQEVAFASGTAHPKCPARGRTESQGLPVSVCLELKIAYRSSRTVEVLCATTTYLSRWRKASWMATYYRPLRTSQFRGNMR